MRSTVDNIRVSSSMPVARRILRLGLRLAVLAALWFLLTGGDAQNLWLGALFVAGGALLGSLLESQGASASAE